MPSEEKRDAKADFAKARSYAGYFSSVPYWLRTTLEHWIARAEAAEKENVKLCKMRDRVDLDQRYRDLAETYGRKESDMLRAQERNSEMREARMSEEETRFHG